MRISDGVQTCALPIYRTWKSSDRHGIRCARRNGSRKSVELGEQGGKTEMTVSWSKVCGLVSLTMLLAAPAWAGKEDDTLNIAWREELPTYDAYYASPRESVLLARLVWDNLVDRDKSEEHTSELQSLMRISYAVFCLKKKKVRHTNIKFDHTIYRQSPDTT